ncbi:hypothetical protein I7I53_01747 [Histoplasma capsulatum var. duboisii H88]|uniref:Uncharacterized protein n=1 Tax=Ajellomyces capsulatus (strain H88) TaxID=544711 RepID=A0A8A1LK67_AJEC8|nr:hypothetical protein I7I53_01747 [Histoplasma capsulatum var. duboisii H88]
MAYPEFSSQKLRTCDIVAYDDVELDEYLERTGRVVYVQDPENLPDSFLQRLRDRTYGGGGADKSRPVDLAQVNTRLLQVEKEKEPGKEPQDKQAAPRTPHIIYEQSPVVIESNTSSPRSTPSADLEGWRLELQRRETESYKELVEDGGRASHPFSNTEDIYKCPGELRELLSFWNGRGNQQQEALFTAQLARWKQFRMFQRFMRERNIQDPQVIRIFSGHAAHEDRKWTAFIDRQRPKTGEVGRFPVYARAVKDRLVRHGFLRNFQLDEDPTRQDNLTTWIEYLGYEYWWHDRYALSIHQEQWLESKWKEIVDSNVLRHSETRESIAGFEPSMLRYEELNRSQELVDTAKSAVIAARKAISDSETPRHRSKELEQRLIAAQSKLIAEEEKCDFIRRRNKIIGAYIQDTSNHLIFKENAQRHSILLRWILDQLPLVELDMKSSETVANTLNDESVRKPSFDQADQRSEGDVPRNQEDNGIEQLATSHSQTHIATTSQESKGRKRGSDIPSEEQLSKRPRRNGGKGAVDGYTLYESAATGAATDVAASERSHNPNPPASKITRQKQKPTTVTVEVEGNVKEIEKVSSKGALHDKRPAKPQTRSHKGAPKTPASRITRQKPGAATVSANKEADAETDQISSRGISLRNRRKKNLPSDPQLSSATHKPLRRSLRLAQRRAAINARMAAPRP